MKPKVVALAALGIVMLLSLISYLLEPGAKLVKEFFSRVVQ